MNFIKKAQSQVKKTLSSGEKVLSGLAHGSSGASVYSGQTFLHGHLIIEIRAASNLPDMEGWVAKLVDKKDVTDPFVDVILGMYCLILYCTVYFDVQVCTPIIKVF